MELLFICVCQTATIWLTVVVAASRCLAVCWPAKAGVYCSLEVTRLGTSPLSRYSMLRRSVKFSGVAYLLERRLTITILLQGDSWARDNIMDRTSIQSANRDHSACHLFGVSKISNIPGWQRG